MFLFFLNYENEEEYIWSMSINEVNLLLKEKIIISKTYFVHDYLKKNIDDETANYQDFLSNIKETEVKIIFYGVDNDFAKQVVKNIEGKNINYELKKSVNLDLQQKLFQYLPLNEEFSLNFSNLNPIILHEISNYYFNNQIGKMLILLNENLNYNFDYLLNVNDNSSLSNFDELLNELKLIILNLKNNSNEKLEEYYLKIMDKSINFIEKNDLDEEIVNNLLNLINSFDYQFKDVEKEKYLPIINRKDNYYVNKAYMKNILPKLKSNYTNNYLIMIDDALFLLDSLKSDKYLNYNDQIETGIMNQISGIIDYLNILEDQRISTKEECKNLINSIVIIDSYDFINKDLNGLIDVLVKRLNNCVK